MPLIELTTPAGVLPPETGNQVQRDLAAALLKWEGAPDTEFFRSLAWSHLREVPAGALITAADAEPRFRADVTVPQGALSERRKAGLVAEVTEIVLRAAGLDRAAALRVWVLVHEQPDGSWGAGGEIIRHADLVALAGGERGSDA
ncbi:MULTISPECIES: tautomerase family protein [unclassified Saccharopolyspora]|uniref:tautomerase family protein n=1 Tax=unclassified Saccharopolyspora TaxID=2646250 RepID=UPI001CD45698|nr:MULTISPECIES: tautomerase family protein [unclassified Saccharopolyspora]MCA1194834.1 tautomerase family protein [Saccharopolyspora sp. 6V]MCA1228143.1 tautomerase family protein [Saccharopolyspora sp. 6M]MCA1282223.1 tautomerase family protein [Saccharopolyspora sp. 7B]